MNELAFCTENMNDLHVHSYSVAENTSTHGRVVPLYTMFCFCGVHTSTWVKSDMLRRTFTAYEDEQ